MRRPNVVRAYVVSALSLLICSLLVLRSVRATDREQTLQIIADQPVVKVGNTPTVQYVCCVKEKMSHAFTVSVPNTPQVNKEFVISGPMYSWQFAKDNVSSITPLDQAGTLLSAASDTGFHRKYTLQVSVWWVKTPANGGPGVNISPMSASLAVDITFIDAHFTTTQPVVFDFNPGVHAESPESFIQQLKELKAQITALKASLKEFKEEVKAVRTAVKTLSDLADKVSRESLPRPWEVLKLYSAAKKVRADLTKLSVDIPKKLTDLNSQFSAISKVELQVSKRVVPPEITVTLSSGASGVSLPFKIVIDNEHTTWLTKDSRFGNLSIDPSSGNVDGSVSIKLRADGNLGYGRINAVIGDHCTAVLYFNIKGVTQQQAIALLDTAYDQIKTLMAAVRDEQLEIVTILGDVAALCDAIAAAFVIIGFFFPPMLALAVLFAALSGAFTLGAGGVYAGMYYAYAVDRLTAWQQYDKLLQQIKDTYPVEP